MKTWTHSKARQALNEKLLPRERLMAAAVSRVNQSGHAQFGLYELQTMLGKDLGGGDRKLATRSVVYKAIDAMKDAGLLLPESGIRCLVLPKSDHQQGWGDGGCTHHGISASEWS